MGSRFNSGLIKTIEKSIFKKIEDTGNMLLEK